MPDPRANKIINYPVIVVKNCQKPSQNQLLQIVLSALTRKHALTIVLFVLPNPHFIQLILVYLWLEEILSAIRDGINRFITLHNHCRINCITHFNYLLPPGRFLMSIKSKPLSKKLPALCGSHKMIRRAELERCYLASEAGRTLRKSFDNPSTSSGCQLRMPAQVAQTKKGSLFDKLRMPARGTRMPAQGAQIKKGRLAGFQKICILLMVLLTITSALALGLPSQAAQAGSAAGNSEYFIPGSADQIAGILYDLDPYQLGSPFNLTNVITIAIGANNTTVRYDHWETGYGNAVETYTANQGSVLTFKSTTLPSTGVTPTTSCAGSTNPNGATTACYDGRDRIYVTGGTVSVAQVFWPTSADTLYASAWEIYPIKPYQTSYTIPVGEDLYGTGSFSDFQKVYVIAQALSDATQVQIDDPTTGGVDVNANLNSGEVTQLWHTHVGTTIAADKPVQVQFIIGNNSTHYNSRSYTAVPSSLWSSAYFSPVPGAANGNTDLFIFNPNTSALNIDYQDTTGSGSFQVAANSTVSYQAKVGRYVPQNSGVSLAASDGTTTFWAIGSGDSGSADYNWGFSLIPANLLTSEYYISWSPGSSNLTSATNGSPVYVSPIQDNTTVFVDYSPTNGVVDATYTLNRLQEQKIFDPDKDNTGTHIWATAPIAAVWGEDPDSAPTGSPGIDAGYTILPFNQNWIDIVTTLAKTANPSSIAPLANQSSTFTLTINAGAYGLNDVYITDVLPTNWAYVAGSTMITWPGGSSAADPSGVPGLNLSWGSPGAPLASLAANQTITVVYQARTTAIPASFSINTATAIGTYNGELYTASGSAIVVSTSPDLTVIKTNNQAGNVLVGNSFNWNLQVLNGSSSGMAQFTTGQIILRDYLPAGPAYGTPAVTTGAIPPVGTGTINCSISSNVLTCTASGGIVMLPTGSIFNVAFSITPAVAGTLVNPTGGVCQADPNGVVAESNEANNNCTNAVTVVSPATIIGTIYNDLNGNGSFNTGEPGISGVTVTLSNGATTTTNASGFYSFTNLLPGTYSVTETDLPGYLSTGDTQGANNNVVGNITVAAGATSSGNNFFDCQPATITGYVYNDQNGNGSFDAGEPGISGVTLTLSNGATTTTDASGFYSFTNLSAGTYSVTETDLPGYVSTGDIQGANNNVVGNITVASGTTGSGNNFFDWQRATITGYVYNDQNGNGSFNTGEPGINNVTVTLSNGATITTNASGFYSFTNLPAGIYSVTETDPNNYVSTGDTQGANDNVVSGIVAVVGANSSGNNFFDWRPATITGHVYNDLNGNGSFNYGEPGISGVTLTLSNGATTTTDASGYYSFTNLPTGTYSVTETDLPGYVSTGDSQNPNDNLIQNLVMAAGQTRNNNNFFDRQRATITGYVYNDLNGNGSFNTGEPGISGVIVTLSNGAATTTDASGYYSFTNLPAGTYSVTETDLAGYFSTGDTQGANDNVIGSIVAVVGATSSGNNFFDRQPATISGHLYYDVNGNGAQDTGEPNLANVDVVVTDVLGQMQTVTTDGSGNWMATVLPGTTTAVVQTADPDFAAVVPAGWTQTQGTPTNPVTAVGGANTNAGADGYYTPGTISGHLYFDINGNATQGSGEPDLANVDVLVTDVLGHTQIVSTDGSGNWFATVPPGSTTAIVQTTDPDFTAIVSDDWIQSEGTPTNPVMAVAGANTYAGNDGYYTNPTAVNLTYFYAVPAGPFAIEIKWHTAFGSKTVGFNIYRSEQPDGPFTRLNVHLIAPNELDWEGGAYTFIDKNVTPAVTYYYKLEHISTSYVASDYGQVSAQSIPCYLPLMIR
jgi:hypothetical protein